MSQQGPQQKGEEQQHGDADDKPEVVKKHDIKYRREDNGKG